MKTDRLTSLLDRMRLRVSACDPEAANLVAIEIPAEAEGWGPQFDLLMQTEGAGIDTGGMPVVFSLSVDFGGPNSLLAAALPPLVQERVVPDSDACRLVDLLAAEQRDARCGGPAVLSRLGEVLVVWILRGQIYRGAVTSGMFGGLSHPRIFHAMVAMHEDPGKAWRNADLAELAGLSHSRFKELFLACVGVTPMVYLRRWRLSLARNELQQGDRIEQVARRYGYGAPDAFSRAYRREFGCLPSAESNRAA